MCTGVPCIMENSKFKMRRAVVLVLSRVACTSLVLSKVQSTVYLTKRKFYLCIARAPRTRGFDSLVSLPNVGNL
jgi:hypothetical protein